MYKKDSIEALYEETAGKWFLMQRLNENAHRNWPPTCNLGKVDSFDTEELALKFKEEWFLNHK